MAKTLGELTAAIERAITSLPGIVGTEAVNFSKERFVEQDWFGSARSTWKLRSCNRRGGKKRQNGAVLVDSGRLKRSIRVVSSSPERVVVGTDVPYAQIHNDGFEGTVHVKAYMRKSKKGTRINVREHDKNMKMPKRQFVGESDELNRRLERAIVDEIKYAITL